MAKRNLEKMAPSLFPDMAPPAVMPNRREHLTFKANRLHGRHGWLRLTPAYSVHIVEELLAQRGASDRVLDPFCGTGTTALVCAQKGILCHTIDINPFLVWLANVKCRTFTADDLALAGKIFRQALEASEEVHAPVWTPPLFAISKWWDKQTLHQLANIWNQIQLARITESARDLLYVIFCRSLIECAAVSFGHQSMSFKRQPTNMALFEDAPATPLAAIFQRVANTVFLSAEAPLAHARSQAFIGDARTMPTILPESYTLVVTSPPYPNRMSYIRELRPYMYWLGYLTTGREAGELDWQAIGGTWGCATSNLSTWVSDPAIPIPYEGFSDVVAQITTRSRTLGLYVAKYFEDIVHHVRSLRTVLAPGATVHYVIGNSKFYDVMLHTEQIYAAIFEDQRFQDVSIQTLRKRTSKKELYEYVVSARMPA